MKITEQGGPDGRITLDMSREEARVLFDMANGGRAVITDPATYKYILGMINSAQHTLS